MQRSIFLRIILFAFMICSLVSCQWEAKRPSFLVIAVDSLPFDSIHCNETEKWQGFREACDQMIRFTHAYTPSVLAVPAMTSLLTGRYPFEHGVWNNGSTFLNAKWETSAEVSFSQGYRTLFVSGGPPIWKKSGLDQGFQNFDDNISIDYGKYYRPAKDNFKIFQDWIEQTKDSPFFSFIYLSDLQFAETPTTGNDGYAREKTYDGQLHAVDDALANFFTYLHENNYWDNTWIVLVGLNGTSQESREKNFRGANLFHENTNVALFIKPPQLNSDSRNAWTVDGNVSLVDVGRTFFDLLNREFKEPSETLFPTISLRNVLTQEKDLDSDRILLMESGWPQWRKLGSSLFALQKESYLLLYQNPPKLFNTLIDRNEIYPINTRQNSMQILTQTAQQLINLISNSDTVAISEDNVEKYSLVKKFFLKDTPENTLTQARLLFRRNGDDELAGWLARASLARQNWQELFQLGAAKKQIDWIWVASKNLGLAGEVPNSCVGIFANASRLEELRDPEVVCADPLIIDFLNWVKHKRKPDMAYYRDMFFKSYKYFAIDLEIQRLDMQNGYVWDVSKDKISKPQNIELVLSLPEYAKYKKQLENIF